MYWTIVTENTIKWDSTTRFCWSFHHQWYPMFNLSLSLTAWLWWKLNICVATPRDICDEPGHHYLDDQSQTSIWSRDQVSTNQSDQKVMILTRVSAAQRDTSDVCWPTLIVFKCLYSYSVSKYVHCVLVDKVKIRWRSFIASDWF